MSYATRTMIVPAVYQQLAQGLCEAAAEGDAGKGMFTTALSADGQEPATHYISAGPIEQQFADILPLTAITPAAQDGEAPAVSTRPGNAAVVEGMAAQAGIILPAGTVAALLAATDVSEQEPFAAMARLGIKLIEDRGTV